ncbi:MAG TPA: SMC family ATPase, partial [Armatimonadetes bacterium]|nr:SMC family ATPase [Armatimonadota bacterium]
MIIQRIKVENFATYKSAELDFSRLGSTISVFGSTGAGKTTFFVDAITIALYGRAYGQLDKRFARQVIPRWASSSRIEVDFEAFNGSRYRIIRILRKDRESDALLYKIDERGEIERLVASGVRAVEEEVLKLIGLDFITFINTIVVRQGRVAELISRDISPSERRKIFLKAFNLDFSSHKDRARELYLEAREELNKVVFEIGKIKEEIERESEVKMNIVQLELKLREVDERIKHLNNVKSEIEAKLKVLQDEKHEIERQLVELDGIYNLISRCRGELQSIIIELDRLEDFIKKKDALERRYNLLSRQLSFLQELYDLERDANNI